MRYPLKQPVGIAAQSPGKRYILLFYIFIMPMLAGYQAASAWRYLLIGYRVWIASTPVTGSLIGCYRRLLERHRTPVARDKRGFFNRSPVSA
jgi:hypothetical protein